MMRASRTKVNLEGTSQELCSGDKLTRFKRCNEFKWSIASPGTGGSLIITLQFGAGVLIRPRGSPHLTSPLLPWYVRFQTVPFTMFERFLGIVAVYSGMRGIFKPVDSSSAQARRLSGRIPIRSSRVTVFTRTQSHTCTRIHTY